MSLFFVVEGQVRGVLAVPEPFSYRENFSAAPVTLLPLISPEFKYDVIIDFSVELLNLCL